MFEWTPVTENDYMSIEIIQLVWKYQQDMKDLVLRFIGRNVILEEVDTSMSFKTIPSADRINRIERNLMNLVGTDVPEDMVKTTEWHGMLRDNRRIDYTDVNRWFGTLQILYIFILRLQQRYLTTGTFHSGKFPDLQLLGVI